MYTCSASVAYLNSYGSSTSCSGTPITTSLACVASVTTSDKYSGAYYSITCNPANYLTIFNCSSNFSGSYPLGTWRNDGFDSDSYMMSASTSGSVTTATVSVKSSPGYSLNAYTTFSIPFNATCSNGSPYSASVTTTPSTLASLQTMFDGPNYGTRMSSSSYS